MKKRILCLSMAVLMLLTSVFSLASCMGGGGGTANTPCTTHTDANHDGTCDVATCGATGLEVKHEDAQHTGTCTVCGQPSGATHSEPDANYKCTVCGKVIPHTCEDTDADGKCNKCGADVAACEHKDEDGDGICDLCNEEMTLDECEHVDADSDNECDLCGEDVDCFHVDLDGNTKCDYCQAHVEAEEDFNYEWNQTTINVQLTENTNDQEILSVSRKYLAGDITAGSDNISDAVRQRNALAEAKTKVKVNYIYYPDNDEYNWSKNIERIKNTNQQGGADAPDIYSNFVYDMVGASLGNCFANLLTDTRDGQYDNYFRFKEADYNAATNDEGYMYEYMESLTLAPGKKMYILSSDYYIDMVRAFFCIPVSVKIMKDTGAAVVAEGVNGATYANGDRNNDGAFDIEDFYEMVLNREWTYDALAKFSEKAYKPAYGNDTGCKITDDRVGFAMASGGVAASGLLYTTSVQMITKTQNGTEYSYDYPPENEDFYAFCDATKDLFKNSTGVVFVDKAEGYEHTYLAIRAKFTENKVLFGDIMLVGALEFSEYQEMNKEENGGFGIVPVPLFRTSHVDDTTGETVNDNYLTQVHNVGACGAISTITEKFPQCTAFLNYQSTHSEQILNNYYKYKLQYNLAGDSAGTITMLQYLRDNVRSSFDKVMEDAIAVFSQDQTNEETRWHSILSRHKFQIDIRSEYQSAYDAKESYLDSLAIAFQGFFD